MAGGPVAVEHTSWNAPFSGALHQEQLSGAAAAVGCTVARDEPLPCALGGQLPVQEADVGQRYEVEDRQGVNEEAHARQIPDRTPVVLVRGLDEQ